MQQTRTSSLPVQRREVAFAPATLDAEARTIALVWSTGAKVRRYDWWEDEIFEEELSLDPAHVRMDRMTQGAVPVLKDHVQSLDNVVGTVISAQLAEGEAQATARFDTGSEEDDRVWRKVSTGTWRNISVGYTVHRYEVTREPGKVPVYRATDWEPLEISLVAVPADVGAGTRAESAGGPCEIIERNQNQEKTPMPASAPVEVPPTTPPDLDAVRSAAVTEFRTRAAAIRKEVRSVGLPDALADRLVDEDKSLDQARAAIIQELATRDDKTEIRSHIKVGAEPGAPAETRAALVNALAAGWSSRVKIAGAAQQFRGYTPLGIAMETLKLQGRAVNSWDKEVMVRAALHTTSDFPQLLADAANMVLQTEYTLANPVYQQIAAQKTFTDFKPTTFLTAGDFPDLERLGEHGEVKAGSMSEAGERVQLDTWARKIGVSRRMLINDDLGVFGDFSTKAARRIVFKENAIVFGLLAQNGGAGPKMADGKPLFCAEHGNKAAAAAIDVAGLDACRAALRKQKSLDGLTLNIKPQILLAGPDQETKAEMITASIVAAATGNVNPFSGKLAPVVDASIDDLRWYLFADPADFECMVYGYLNGQGPRMATREGWDTDGVEFRVIHDFAAGVVDWRGAIFNPGR